MSMLNIFLKIKKILFQYIFKKKTLKNTIHRYFKHFFKFIWSPFNNRDEWMSNLSKKKPLFTVEGLVDDRTENQRYYKLFIHA